MQYEIFTPYQRMPAYFCNITEPLNNFFSFGRVVYYNTYAYAHIILSYIEYYIFYRNYPGHSDMIMQDFLNLIPFPEFSYAIYNKNVAALDILSTNENFMNCLKYIGDFYSQEYVNSGQDQQYSLLIYFIYILSNSLKQKIFVFSYDNNSQLKYFEILQEPCNDFIYLFIQQGSNNFVIFYPIQGLNHFQMVSRLLNTTDTSSTMYKIVENLPKEVSNAIKNPQKNSKKGEDMKKKLLEISKIFREFCVECQLNFEIDRLLMCDKKYYCFKCAIPIYKKLLDEAKNDTSKLKFYFTIAVEKKFGIKFTKLPCCEKNIKSKLVLNKENKFVHDKCPLNKKK